MKRHCATVHAPQQGFILPAAVVVLLAVTVVATTCLRSAISELAAQRNFNLHSQDRGLLEFAHARAEQRLVEQWSTDPTAALAAVEWTTPTGAYVSSRATTALCPSYSIQGTDDCPRLNHYGPEPVTVLRVLSVMNNGKHDQAKLETWFYQEADATAKQPEAIVLSTGNLSLELPFLARDSLSSSPQRIAWAVR